LLALKVGNQLHVQRLITVYEVNPRKLPLELRNVLTAADRKAIRDPPAYFRQLVGNAQFPWLRQLLRKCGQCEGWHLEFTAENDEPYVPYFRLYWGGLPALCLPRGDALPPDLPGVLQHFYSLLGGFRENDFGTAGGIYRPSELRTLAEVGVWVSDAGEMDPARAIPFQDSLCGDFLCYLIGGGGARYYHESGKITRVPSLEKEVAQYFNALLKGRLL
jgi:hypothetical protein